MTFKIFDRALRLVETISHQERAVIGCEYDAIKDILVLGGAFGKTSTLSIHSKSFNKENYIYF